LSFSRGDLLTRLIVLVAAASAPAIAVHAYLQSDLRAGADRAMLGTARHGAELLHAELGSVVEGARQVASLLGQLPSVQQFSSDCAVSLAAINRAMPRYDLLRVVDENARVICSITEQPSMVDAQQRQQNEMALARGNFEADVVMPGKTGAGPVVAFSQPFAGRDQRRGVVNIGISTRWIVEHVAALHLPAGATATIADRDGIILATIPASGLEGMRLEPPLLGLLDASQVGASLLQDEAGGRRPTGFVPISAPPVGLFVAVSLSPAATVSMMADRGRQADLMMVFGTVLSFGLALAVGQIFVRRPTNALLDAARQWSLGDLETRVEISSGRHTEFGKLALAFNAMAAALARQRFEAAELLDTLEARVAARTDELVKSRDRLQVSMAQQAKSEASLNQMQKLQAVGQLAGGIAHDFNNLLTAVISALEILRNRLPAEDERSQRLLDSALHAADRGGRLTSKLLSFSRRQLLVPVPIDLNTVLLGMVSLLTTTLGRNIRVETGLAPALWPALVDPNQVESAILNLALNARDAMPDGGTLRLSTINVSIPVSNESTEHETSAVTGAGRTSLVQQERLAGDFVMIRVRDTGNGMAPAVLARAFEPFFTTKRQGRGTGLGLSQVHGLAAQSGGEVRLSSEVGLGTTVSLLLPRAAVGSDIGSRPDNGTSRPVGLKVLLVDDDVDVRNLTAEMLSELGHRSMRAADGPEALALLDDEGDIDILLTDYAMPGMDGLELIEQVRRERPSIRAVLMTGHADIDLSRHVREHPVLRKPFTMAALSQVLESMSIHSNDMARHPGPTQIGPVQIDPTQVDPTQIGPTRPDAAKTGQDKVRQP
jgi:signal transduction histidine kinase